MRKAHRSRRRFAVAGSSCRSFALIVTAGLTLVSAVVLGLSLVAIPPDVSGTRTEVRSVQLAAFRPPSATPLGAALRKYVCTQANTGVSVTPVIVGAPDITDRWRTGPPRVPEDSAITGSPTHAPFSPSNGD